SFHMVVARHSHGQLTIIDRLREMVRLAAGVAENGRIDKEVAARALACLERFGQRLRDMRADSVRVVGTNALRQAHRKQAFLERAREALGHPIEIIGGMERARLAARLELEPVQAAFRRRGWDACAGSSGTVRAIGDSIRALDPQALSITPAGINRAIEYSIDAGHTRELKLEPITEDRRP